MEQSSETSPDSPRRRACCDERGEATEEAARAGGVRCDRATSPSPAPEGAEETEVRRAQRTNVQTPPPPPSLDRGRAGVEEASRDTAPGAPWDPPSYAAPLKGGKKRRRKSQAAELPKKFPRGEQPPGQGEQSLKGVIFSVPCRFAS